MSTDNPDKRFIGLEGSLNFRDFGGYQTASGKRVQTGKLFRCGMLTGIPDHAYDDFAALNIGVICDLRRQDEVQLAPTPDTAPFHCRIHIPIAPGSSPDLQASLQDPAHTTQHRIDYMRKITREIAQDHVAEYRQLFHELLNVDNGFLLHCTAGKDRTGFGAAMILAALGVPEAHIFDDYLLTNSATDLFDAMLPRFKERYGEVFNEEDLRVIAGVRREYLEAALAGVEESFGSIDGYLEEVGVDHQARQELIKRLLV